MENNVPEEQANQIEVDASLEITTETDESPLGSGVQPPSRELEAAIPDSVKLQLQSIIDRYNLSREDFTSVYDEYAALKAHVAAARNSWGEESMDTGPAIQPQEEGAEGGGQGEEEGGHFQEEVGKMQTLVQTAIQSYETSPSVAESVVKKKLFSLEEELNLRPSSFAQELLDRDQTLVAQAVKKYMNQYSIPQREVVEKTGLNQSHLSQHFLHGVTMKRSKRIKLYHWFEEDQKLRTGKLLSADGSLSVVLESPRVEGNRRRPRWKWSPISTQILTEAFKKNQFPTREQRLELARVCNEAEIAMNNGLPIRGPEGDTEGITEQRVNTWFTNRRKGLASPSPTKGVTTPSSALLLTPTLPPLLKASGISTPSMSGHTITSPLKSIEERSVPTLVPANIQALVSQIQQAQLAGSRQLAARQGMQLTPSSVPLAIALPGTGNVLSPTSNAATCTVSSIHHAPTPTAEVIPVISPNQLQALVTQLQVTSTPSPSFTAPLHFTTSTNSLNSFPNIITIPAAAASVLNAGSVTSPSHTVSSVQAQSSETATPVISSVPTLSANQVQALISHLQTQAKMQGTPQVQIHPGSAVPLAITLPGVSNEELARAILQATGQAAQNS